MLRRWNSGQSGYYSPGFLEWIDWKRDFPSAYRSIAEQPWRIAREFDYLANKYGKSSGNASQMIHDIERAKLLQFIKDI